MQDTQFYQNEYKKLKKMQSCLQEYETLYFYGAGLRSEELLQMQKEGFPFLKRPKAFLVSSKKNQSSDNPEQLGGIPVYCIDEIREFPENSAIIVIAMDIYHGEIRRHLSGIACSDKVFCRLCCIQESFLNTGSRPSFTQSFSGRIF